MQRTDWDIADFIHTYIEGFIFNDIETCIKAEASHVVALALLSYTEFIGGLISGNLGKSSATENFGMALKLFPEEYRKVNSSIQIQYVDKGKLITHKTGIYDVF